MEFGTCTDEIKQYLDAQYVSSCEALWCLYLFPMKEQTPAIVHLQVHLPNYRPIIFEEDDDGNVQDLVDTDPDHDTTLTAWFKANA
jgi:hypothetical protein